VRKAIGSMGCHRCSCAAQDVLIEVPALLRPECRGRNGGMAPPDHQNVLNYVRCRALISGFGAAHGGHRQGLRPACLDFSSLIRLPTA